MALVYGAIGREEVDVVVALGVPDVDARCAGEDDRKRVVVVSGELVLGVDGTLGRGRVVSGGTSSAIDCLAGGLVCVGSHGCDMPTSRMICAHEVGQKSKQLVIGDDNLVNWLMLNQSRKYIYQST